MYGQGIVTKTETFIWA